MQSPPKRRLRLTSPHTRGEDVRRLQVALNDRRQARGLPKVTVDQEYGPATAAAVRETARALGVLESTIAQGATVGIQRIIRNPKLRTPAQLARAAVRKRAAAKATTGPKAAMKWAESKIGVKEHPAGTNRGPEIDDWEKSAGMGPGPWCGAFARAASNIGGGADVTPEARYCPSIVAHAHAKTGGYEGWCSITDPLAQLGDDVLFDWDNDGVADHVGKLKSVDRARRIAHTVEGNTAIGNDSNGGEVMARERSFDDILGVARVRWS